MYFFANNAICGYFDPSVEFYILVYPKWRPARQTGLNIIRI